MSKEKVLRTVLLLRKDSLENWSKNNPILRAGEMSYVTDLGRCKCGDGKTHWLDLPFFALDTQYNDNATIIIKTKENWKRYDKARSIKGTLYVYTEDDPEVAISPKIKIGDGMAYICDLPFVTGDLEKMLNQHILNDDIHVTLQEKNFWNNKLNIINTQNGVIDNTLIFNRD